MSMTTANKAKVAKIIAAIKPYVDLYLVARAVSEVERKRVDDIQRRVLAEQNYYGRDRHGVQFRVLDSRKSYLMDDESSSRYFERLNAIHLANGFADAVKGFCPALVAEHDTVKAEWALIAAAESFFPGVTNDKLLCGTKDMGGLETRQKYIDLLVGMVVSSPGYRNPLKV
jgi:hypothetical protein